VESTTPSRDGIETIDELKDICAVLHDGSSVIVVGEVGSGIERIPSALIKHFEGNLDCAVGKWKGSGIQFFRTLAKDWDIPTEDAETGKKLTLDALKQELTDNIRDDMLLILPNPKVPAGVRYWIDDAIGAGLRVACMAAANPNKDIFLEFIEIGLKLPDEAVIRDTMKIEADRQGMKISESEIASLMPLAGRNPMLARKVIQRHKLGLKQQVEHTQYMNIMPIIITGLFSFAIVRFIGMGTNDKELYMIGGVCFTAAMALRQLGKVSTPRKRLGA
jgi:hypothetical protein